MPARFAKRGLGGAKCAPLRRARYTLLSDRRRAAY